PGLAWPASDDPRLVCRPLVGPSIQRRLLVQRRTDEPMGPALRLLMPYISAARKQSPRAYQGPA
ncbi:hypothetical protein, partial [Pseudomonas aeruginosa]|uniref:hypothetical protein n=1 Tax=Pseudomonas aeruginosa TaxID=287 RepID=UPI003C6E76B2